MSFVDLFKEIELKMMCYVNEARVMFLLTVKVVVKVLFQEDF